MLSSVNRARVEIGGNGTEKKIGKQVNLCVFIVTVGPSKPGPLQFFLHWWFDSYNNWDSNFDSSRKGKQVMR